MSTKTDTGLISVNLTNCKYPVVRDCVRRRGWKTVVEDEDGEGGEGKSATPSSRTPGRPGSGKGAVAWDLCWQDGSVSSDRVMAMESWQRINHFPGMHVLYRKDGLARTLKRMARVFPAEFDFFPRTWTIPDDWIDFQAQFPASTGMSAGPGASKVTFIVKPAASSQGRGIFLTRRLDDIDPRTPSVAQRYVAKPFLIDGLKFDMRIYVLVTSVDPLRVWLHDEGLCRFATSPYVAPSNRNLSDLMMHLTNYAIQKDSPAFVFNTGGVESGNSGSKRTLTWFKGWLDSNGYSSVQVFGRIAHMINKALLAAQPHLVRTYRSVVSPEGNRMMAFELLGLDVLMDAKLRPWLIEVNHSPSLTCDTKLDYQIKAKVVGESMDLLRLRASARRKGKAKILSDARKRLYGAASSPASERRRGDSAAAEESHAFISSSSSGAPLGGAVMEGVVPGSTCCRLVPKGAPISAAHQRHEIATAKGYRLIFPPPDASEIQSSVFTSNAREVESMYTTMIANGVLVSPKSGGGGGGATTPLKPPASVASDIVGPAVEHRRSGCDDDDEEEEEEEAKCGDEGDTSTPSARTSASRAGTTGSESKVVETLDTPTPSPTSTTPRSRAHTRGRHSTSPSPSTSPVGGLAARRNAGSGDGKIDDDAFSEGKDDACDGVGIGAGTTGGSECDSTLNLEEEGEEEEEESPNNGAGTPSSTSVTVSTSVSVPAAAAGMYTVIAPVVEGVPKPFIRPWDASLGDLHSRLRQYRIFAAVAEELYFSEEKIGLSSGRRAAESVGISSAALIASAMKSILGGDSGMSVTSPPTLHHSGSERSGRFGTAPSYAYPEGSSGGVGGGVSHSSRRPPSASRASHTPRKASVVDAATESFTRMMQNLVEAAAMKKSSGSGTATVSMHQSGSPLQLGGICIPHSPLRAVASGGDTVDDESLASALDTAPANTVIVLSGIRADGSRLADSTGSGSSSSTASRQHHDGAVACRIPPSPITMMRRGSGSGGSGIRRSSSQSVTAPRSTHVPGSTRVPGGRGLTTGHGRASTAATAVNDHTSSSKEASASPPRKTMFVPIAGTHLTSPPTHTPTHSWHDSTGSGTHSRVSAQEALVLAHARELGLRALTRTPVKGVTRPSASTPSSTTGTTSSSTRSPSLTRGEGPSTGHWDWRPSELQPVRAVHSPSLPLARLHTATAIARVGGVAPSNAANPPLSSSRASTQSESGDSSRDAFTSASDATAAVGVASRLASSGTLSQSCSAQLLPFHSQGSLGGERGVSVSSRPPSATAASARGDTERDRGRGGRPVSAAPPRRPLSAASRKDTGSFAGSGTGGELGEAGAHFSSDKSFQAALRAYAVVGSRGRRLSAASTHASEGPGLHLGQSRPHSSREHRTPLSATGVAGGIAIAAGSAAKSGAYSSAVSSSPTLASYAQVIRANTLR